MNLLDSRRSADERGVALVNAITDCLRDFDWERAEGLIRAADVATEDLAILVTILAGTRHMPRINLPSRPKFFLDVFKRYETDKGFKEAKFALLHLQ